MRFLRLGDHGALDPKRVGGKVAALSRLIRLVPHVPDGFVLPMDVVGQIPRRALREEIERAVNSLTTRHGLHEFAAAVRSSAVDEDGAEASFAGQYESFLNVRGTDEIWQAVNRCWESALLERAQAYRRQQSAAHEGAGLAVLVQQFVAADVSAVVFCANPVNGVDREPTSSV